MNIGVAVSTRNRPDLLATAVSNWVRHTPYDCPVVVVDDASDPPAPYAYRFDENVGVAAVKNKSIELLMDLGVEHLFLVDDDVWPVDDRWWQPYVEDPEPHLMLCWGRSRRLHADDQHTVWSHPRGVVLYAERRVIDTVGGMRTEFGHMGHEHVEWSTRIHAAGLTTHRFTDVAGSRNLFHAEDWGRPGESHADLGKRRARASLVERKGTGKRRLRLMEEFAGSTDFVDYRTP